MALNDIIFIRGQGIGGTDPINSHISGLQFYSNTLPSGFATDDRIKAVFGLSQAEELGIVNDFADETKATAGTIEITTKGATGDIETISVGGAVIAQYTLLASDSDADAEAAGIGAAINAGTNEHGFSATVSTDTVTVNAPDGLGKAFDAARTALTGAALTFASSGTGVATVTDFGTNGVGSFNAVMHYHISEFFRMKSDGKLWIAIHPETSFDGTGIASMLQLAKGEIRRVGVFVKNEPFATSQLSAVQNILVDERDEHRPASAIFHANAFSLDSATLANLTTATSSKVNVNMGEDANFLQPYYSVTKRYTTGDKVRWLDGVYISIGASLGVPPYNTGSWTRISTNLRDITGYSISTLGNEVGTKATGAISQNIGEVGVFNLTAGNILSEAGIATGERFAGTPRSLFNDLASKNYTFLREFEGREGVYYNDSYTAISRSNDFRSLERNEVMDEAERLVYNALLPYLNSRILLNASGQLDRGVINYLEDQVSIALNALLISGDISALSVTINPNQNILQTSTLEVIFDIVPVAIGRNIVVRNTYRLSV